MERGQTQSSTRDVCRRHYPFHKNGKVVTESCDIGGEDGNMGDTFPSLLHPPTEVLLQRLSDTCRFDNDSGCCEVGDESPQAWKLARSVYPDGWRYYDGFIALKGSEATRLDLFLKVTKGDEKQIGHDILGVALCLADPNTPVPPPALVPQLTFKPSRGA